MISTSAQQDKNLTIHVVTGQVHRDELLGTAMGCLESAPARASLWDFTEARFSALSTQDLVSLFDAMLPHVHDRRGGRAALLFGSTVGFGLGRLSEALVEVRDYPCEIKAFTDRGDALLWLDLPVDLGAEDGGEGVA